MIMVTIKRDPSVPPPLGNPFRMSFEPTWRSDCALLSTNIEVVVPSGFEVQAKSLTNGTFVMQCEADASSIWLSRVCFRDFYLATSRAHYSKVDIEFEIVKVDRPAVRFADISPEGVRIITGEAVSVESCGPTGIAEPRG